MNFLTRLFGKSSGRKNQDVKGIGLLIEVCTRDDIMDKKPLWNRALEDLKMRREGGSRALADLIREMLRCRSEGIGPAIAMAENLPPTPELITALEEVQSATPITLVVPYARFTSQIAGGGKIGWTDGTAERIKSLAVETLNTLRRST